MAPPRTCSRLQDLFQPVLRLRCTNRPTLPVGYAYLDGVATMGSSIKTTINNPCVKPVTSHVIGWPSRHPVAGQQWIRKSPALPGDFFECMVAIG